MCVREDFGANQLLYDGGDATLLVHKGKELKVQNAKDGMCEDHASWLEGRGCGGIGRALRCLPS